MPIFQSNQLSRITFQRQKIDKKFHRPPKKSGVNHSNGDTTSGLGAVISVNGKSAYNVRKIEDRRKENCNRSINWLSRFRSQMPPSGPNRLPAMKDNGKNANYLLMCIIDAKLYCTPVGNRGRKVN
jgi:hypothetical protein